MASLIPTSLPSFPTRFVGREGELCSLERWFASGGRLVTITGAPGMGKTRLALQYAEQASDALYPDGVWFVDLSSSRTIGELCASIASELGVVSGREGSLITRVGHALGARGDTLVILDNFEQLLATDEPVHALTAWINATTGVRFLVTSREILRAKAELVCELEPLPVPNPQGLTRAAALAASSVALLAERAPALTITDENAPLFAEVLAALEGIPLAIELSASRLSTLGPAAVLTRMANRLDLLGRGERDAHQRQRTLRGAFDWSWELLNEAERAALAAASVFEHGFDAAAFEAVCGTGDEPSFDTLQALREKSLVRVLDAGSAGEPRFGLYESMRAYAAERLEKNGEGAARRDRHASYFAGAALQKAAQVHGRSAPDALAWLGRELDNLIVAAEHLRVHTSRESLALRAQLLVACEPVVLTRGPLERYEKLLDELLTGERFAELAPGHAARALRTSARFLRQRGCMPESEAALSAACAEAERDSDAALSCDVLSDWGELAQDRGQFARAGELYERALAALPETGDPRARARALGGLGVLHHSQGRLDEAYRAYSQALDCALRADDHRRQAALYKDLGSLRLQQGRLDEAKDFYGRSRTLLEHLTDPLLAGLVDANLAILAQEQRLLEEARELFERAERRLNRHGARLLSAHVRGYAGALLHELGELAAAAQRYEQASAVLREFGDIRNEGLFSALLGACEAARDRQAASEEALARAQGLLVEVGDPGLFETLELCRAHATLALARNLAGRGDAAQSHALRAEVTALSQAHRERASRATPQLSDDARLALRLLEAALGRDAWVFDMQRAELRPPEGEPIELETRPQLLRVVRALVEARLATPGEALNQEQLTAVGWPGERMQPAAAANRVKVALSTLRSAGLRELLVRRAGGYLLDPNVPLVAHGAPQDAEVPERRR